MTKEMHYGDDYKYIPMTSMLSMVGQAATPDIYCFTIQVVNVCFVGDPGKNDGWTLVDAGMPRSADAIIKEAEERFGPGTKPKAIVLTHGHFDHVGAIIELLQHWDVPVYAHVAELPYLNGSADYPEPDPSVGGGLVARMSSYFPNEAINLGDRVKPLPADFSVPTMPGWKWIHTPGHAPGHISLFREADRALIAGDAFVTVKQESLFKVLVQEKEVSGPPKYLTTDWDKAWESVRSLEALKPTVAVTGHGGPISGEELTRELAALAADFQQRAIPDQGKYLD
ncbi:MAG: MBL fold metallo-hydrolase [Lysinibacillus sp.]